MNVGISEYWIVSPQNRTIQIFSLNKDGKYSEPNMYLNDDIVQSIVFDDFKVGMMKLFE